MSLLLPECFMCKCLTRMVDLHSYETWHLNNINGHNGEHINWRHPINLQCSVFHTICKHTHPRESGMHQVGFGKEAVPEREASSSENTLWYFYLSVNEWEKRKSQSKYYRDSMGRNLCRKAHHMKGKAEKNRIMFKSCRKFDFINEEKKKYRGADNLALDQPQCFYNELWMWIIPKVSIRLWNTWGQRLGCTPSLFPLSLSLSLSSEPGFLEH